MGQNDAQGTRQTPRLGAVRRVEILGDASAPSSRCDCILHIPAIYHVKSYGQICACLNRHCHRWSDCLSLCACVQLTRVSTGNGPSALILSYILHGHIPHYLPSPPHPDPLLHTKLVEHPGLLRVDVPRLTEHFEAAQFSYSTQALPINVLLDTLVRPNGDTCDLEKATNIAWRHQPEKAIPHVVIGNTASPGGQWVENPVQASRDIGTLSYAGMLSLPGYSFAEHYRRTTGQELPSFTRPSRRQVTDYFRAYPHRVLIDDAVYCGQTVSGITRTGNGFHIRSHGISCEHLVLASGVFSELIPARPLLQLLLHLPGPSAQPSSTDIPLLVVGSGFSAADVITSCPPDQKIIHIYKWAPSTSPSPLRACHQQAYPEYAGMYRRMKQATGTNPNSFITTTTTTTGNNFARQASRPKVRRTSTSAFNLSRDWDSKYEGLPNTSITDVKVEGETALVTLQRANGARLQRRVGRLEYVVGRRGSLAYLSRDLRREVCGDHNLEAAEMLSSQTLRAKVLEDIEVAPDVFAVGSLTGDSLIRFAYGSCTYAAGRIMASEPEPGRRCRSVQQVKGVGAATDNATLREGRSNGVSTDAVAAAAAAPPTAPPTKVMNGLDGHMNGHGHGNGSSHHNHNTHNNNLNDPNTLTEPLDRRKH